MLNIADTIGKAREYLEKHGWVSGEVKVEDHVCSYGALLMALDWLDSDNEIRDDVDQRELIPVANHLLVYGVGVELIKTESPVSTSIQQIVGWNDHPERTEQEVIDAFAKAEKVARAGFDPDAS